MVARLRHGEHILMLCLFATQVRFTCFQELHIQANISETDNRVQDWWLEERQRHPHNERKDLEICLMCWSLWKIRNAWVFGNTEKQFSAMQYD